MVKAHLPALEELHTCKLNIMKVNCNSGVGDEGMTHLAKAQWPLLKNVI